MKRLISIANLEEATLCFEQQRTYKAELKTLEDYNHSLELYKSLVKDIKAKTLKYCQDLSTIFAFKKGKTKKRSVVDYFTIMLENLMEHWAEQLRKVVAVAEDVHSEAKEFHRRSEKLVADSSRMMEEQIHYHEKIFREYMLNVYPETDSIFFRLHGADKKFAKRENPSKEAALVQQFKAYEEILSCEIDKIDDNVRQMRELFKKRTEDIKAGYVRLFEACLPEFEGEFREEELESFKKSVEVRKKK